jgi:UDP-N-acetylglucosamine 4,6-dehydratase
MRYLITGGSGSLGQVLVKRLAKDHQVRVYSRDEYKQSEMARKINNPNIEYWLGDVCDLERLKLACEGVDVIIHTAAMKRMDTVSHNSYYVSDVNIRGANNVCIAGKNKKIIFVSTDKAFQPSCIYGASKMIAESIILAHGGVVWRFGNFIGSRGSVWEIFKDQALNNQPLTITDPNATRFVIDMDDVVNHLLSDVDSGIHYPENLRKMTVGEIAKQVAPNAEWKIVGMRTDEKLHEAFNSTYTSQK